MSTGAFLGTSEFAAVVLERLAASDQRPALVATLPDRRQGRGRKESPSPVALKAEELGIELLKSGDVNAPEDRERLVAASSGWASICAFGQLIKEPLLSDLPMLNVHPSLLPRWRGAAPIERAIMEGDAETGVCVMRLVAGLDSGPVAGMEVTPIGPDEDFGTLANRLAVIGGDLLIDGLRVAGGGQLDWAEQDESLVTYAEKISADDRRLDPTLDARRLHDKVRALNPHIGAYLALEGDDRLAIKRTSLLAEDLGPAGRPLEIDGELLLACGRGALRLDLVQPPGKKPMDGSAFLRGYGLPAVSVNG